MAKFTIYSPTGTALYTGTPTFTGQYMKPGLLEFREVALPALVDLVPGCYVDYARTGHRYRIYTVPQLKKQARSISYGGAFVYQSVQLYDASKMLEYCPFRDLVLGDNRIHFSTQPSISTFEGCDGLARRFEACLVDQYGANSWSVRIATQAENPNLYDLMLEPREFTVSGLNILECLDKIYEIWPEVGWIYKVENGKDTIVIGGSGINPNEGTYAYGKGNGLTSLTRTAANAEEIANRIFAYGSSRNMLPRWYNSQDIKDAESVDIQNLMLPVDAIPSMDWNGWGLTDGERDAAKAYVEDSASIAKNGLRPATVYFDGKGEYPEIYPTLRETTIGMVRTALGDSTAKYYPSTAIYTDSNARVDKLLSAQAAFDSGKAGADGKSSTDVGYIAYEHSAVTPITIPAGSIHTEAFASGTIAVSGAGRLNIELSYPGIGLLTGCGSVFLDFSFVKVHGGTSTTIYTQRVVMNPSDAGGHSVPEGKITYAGNTLFESGDSLAVAVNLVFNNQSGATDTTAFLTNASGTMTVKASNHRDKTFTISLRQLGFDINEQADLGNGKTIAMRTGMCAGRSFSINSVQYDSTNDAWVLECWRTEDESLSQWFPNTDYPVRGLENAGQSNEYPGDEFVLLDIAMPDIYISMAEQKLLTAAQELLADTAVERWQYMPEIDAKFMVENGRTIRAGEFMSILDISADDITPGLVSYFRTSGGGYLLTADGEKIVISASSGSVVTVFVDTVVINEGEAAIPTYKVTLRDRKKKTWTESQSPEQSSSKSVGNITNDTAQASTSSGDSFFELDESGNVTLKSQYQNLWVPGWLAAGGIGEGGGGGGYVLPIASASTLGGIKVGSGLSIDANGVLSATGGGGGSVEHLSDIGDVTITDLANGQGIVWDAANGVWRNADVGGGGGGGGADLSDVWASLTNAVSDVYANTKINIAHIPDITTAKITDLESWIAAKGYALSSAVPTESTVSGWGFTKNAGTVTSVTLSSGTGISVTNSGTAITTYGSRTISINSTYQTYITHGEAAYNALSNYATTSDLNSLSGRVSTLEGESFFMLDSSGNVTLKANYSNLWVPGWMAAGGTGSGSSGGGTDLNRVWDSLTNNTDKPNVKINIAHIPDMTTSKITDLESWIAGKGYLTSYTETDPTVPAWAKASSKPSYSLSEISGTGDLQAIEALTGTSGLLRKTAANTWSLDTTTYLTSGTTLDSIADGSTRKLADYVTLGTAQTITGAKTFSGGIVMSGADIYPSADLGSKLGYSTMRFSNACIRDIYAQGIRFRNSANNANTGLISFSPGYMQLQTGSNIDSSFKQLIFDETNGFYPFHSGVNLGYNSATSRWANIYGVNADLSGNLSLASTSHIDIGPLRIEYDATNKALHITKKDNSDTNTYGLYADGFVAAGGVGQTS